MRHLQIILFLTFIIANSGFVAANMACGQVQNTGNESSSWLAVTLFYSSTPNKTTSCQVSPRDNKFCCDPEDIQGITWAIGKNLTALIVDQEKNIYAPPVTLTISGGGYDLFSQLIPQKVLVLTGSRQKVYTNITSYFVNISTINPFNQIGYSVSSPTKKENSTLCTDCTQANFSIETLTEGAYSLIFSANNSKYSFIQNEDFTIIDRLSFNREFVCSKCKNSLVPGKANITVYLEFNASYPVSGELREYIPKEWKVIDIESQPFSDTHQMIIWHLENSTQLKKNYTVSTPDSWLTRKYRFQSSLEGIDSEIDEVFTYRFIKWKWLALPKVFSKKLPSVIAQQEYQQVIPTKPLLIPINDSIFLELSIIPNAPAKSLSIEIIKILPLNPSKKENVLGLAILSDRELKNLGIFRVSYRLDKSLFKKQKTNSTIVQLEHPSRKQTINPTNEDSAYFYYSFNANSTSVIWIHYPK